MSESPLHYRSAAEPLRRSALAARVFVSLFGSYTFVWGASSLLIVAQVAGGIAWDEAWMVAMLVAFPGFLALFLWAYITRSLLRVWLCLFGVGAASTALAAHWQLRLLAGG